MPFTQKATRTYHFRPKCCR